MISDAQLRQRDACLRALAFVRPRLLAMPSAPTAEVVYPETDGEAMDAALSISSQCFRLVDVGCQSPPPEPCGEGNWQLHSQVLALTVRTAGAMLRLYDPQRDRYLLNHAGEAVALRAAEAEVARLRELLG